MMSLDKIKIDIEILTSMFSYGNTEAEFRITELKSLMRNTFREFYMFENIPDMKAKEALLFGSMKNKSPIIFKLNSYKDGNKAAYCSCLGATRKLSVMLLTKENRDFYINLLILSSITSGLGKRSRKGFGAFKITDISTNDEKNISYLSFNKIDSLFERINKDKRYRLRCFEKTKENEFKFKESKVKDFPYIKKLIIKPVKNESLSKIIKALLTQTRLSRKPNSILDKSKRLVEYKRNLPIFILGNTRDDKKFDVNRFASPVCTTFAEINNNLYMVIKQLNYSYMINNSEELKEKIKIKDYCFSENEIHDIKKFAKNYVGKYISQLIKIADY